MDNPGSGALGAVRDELAALQLTELHPLPQTMERQGRGLASTKSKPESTLLGLMSASTSCGHSAALTFAALCQRTKSLRDIGGGGSV